MGIEVSIASAIVCFYLSASVRAGPHLLHQ